VEPTEIRAGDLLLRPWRPDDAAAVTRACQDPVLRRWARGLPFPFSADDGRRFATEIAPTAWAHRSTLGLAVVDAVTGEFLGSVAIHQPDTRPEPGYWSTPDVVRWFGVPEPYTEADAARYVEREAPQEWARGTEAVFVIAGPGDAYAGAVDLRVSPGDPMVGGVGFPVAPRARGYASAAVRALAGWGFRELGLTRIQWRAEVGNDASRRVAEKAGFTMEGLVRHGYDDRGRRHDRWIGSLPADRVAA
jgi:RimJ/RimL family protein N-acetyltransferase